MNNLRDCIFNLNLNEGCQIYLHPVSFDKLSLDYRRCFSDGITNPFNYLGITVGIDNTGRVPLDRVMITDEEPTEVLRIIDLPTSKIEVIYRCGWCGNITDSDGGDLNYIEKAKQIGLHRAGQCKVVTLTCDYCRLDHQ